MSLFQVSDSLPLPQVDTSKVDLNVMRPWVTKRITEILGMEDEVVVEFVINQLEGEKVSPFLQPPSHTEYMSILTH